VRKIRLEPEIKKYLEKFPLKQIVFDWNTSIDLKSTADLAEFQLLLKIFISIQFRNSLFR
jgi:hypothetical protein